MLPSSPLEEPPRSTLPGRGLLLAGVAAAALMGVGLGLWARPAMSERQMALPVVEAPKPVGVRRTLQIVLDDAPAPLGSPIEVLPASAEAPKAAEPERPARELLAPVRPTAGLVRVQTIEPELTEAPPPPKPASKPQAKPKPAPAKVAAPKPEKIKAVAAPKAKPPKLEKPAKLEKVKTPEKAKAKPVATKVAKAEPKPPRPPKAPVRVARVDRPQKPARIEKAVIKQPARLGALVHKVERIPRKAVAAPKPQKAKLIIPKAKPAKPRVEKVVAQKAKPVKVAPPVKALKPARGAGPLRVAKAQPRPDNGMRDADRQMNRAYSSARAAGVPDWQLRRQQARWEAARASAAREAPWAVHDVYLARIAELHDLTKDAQASGY
jgi:hypothetical protein